MLCPPHRRSQLVDRPTLPRARAPRNEARCGAEAVDTRRRPPLHRGDGGDVPMKIVDADGHVAEGSVLAQRAMERWPDYINISFDGRPLLVIEGRRYPEFEGPGAGCPPEHGLSKRDGINPYTLEGVLADADRDHIDTMVLY